MSTGSGSGTPGPRGSPGGCAWGLLFASSSPAGGFAPSAGGTAGTSLRDVLAEWFSYYYSDSLFLFFYSNSYSIFLLFHSYYFFFLLFSSSYYYFSYFYHLYIILFFFFLLLFFFSSSYFFPLWFPKTNGFFRARGSLWPCPRVASGRCAQTCAPQPLEAG